MPNGHRGSVGTFMLACIVAAFLALPSWKLAKRLTAFTSFLFATSRAMWQWSGTVPWDVVFSVGWLGMVQIGEYAISLVCLFLFWFGMFSRLAQSHYGVLLKFVGSVLILAGCYLMVLITLANRGEKPWSGIPDYLASRRPLPAMPEAPYGLPVAPQVTHTSKEALLEAQKELRESLKARDLKSATITNDDKARFEASFWPARLDTWPIKETTLPVVNGAVTVNLTVMAKDHLARKAKVWLRLCIGCKYAKEPIGFKNLSAADNDAHERVLDVGDFLPNVAYAPTISFDVIPPLGQGFFLVGVNAGCENCDPVDAQNFQALRVDIPGTPQ